MYRAFDLKNIPWAKFTDESAAASNDVNNKIARAALEQFINDEKIDGTKLQDHWFPKIQADVFISHSRSDKSAAIKLASLLDQLFGLSSFIDSCVWGHADDLIRLIDKQFAWDEKTKTYNYERSNASCAHVHMMLSTALGNMIDSAECAIFIETPNSITTEESVSGTYSPWLYYEIGLMRIIRPRVPERLMLESFSAKEARAKIQYKLDLSHLTQLDGSGLAKWWKDWPAEKRRGVHALDLLYDIAP
jgi:hypothetical protein